MEGRLLVRRNFWASMAGVGVDDADADAASSCCLVLLLCVVPGRKKKDLCLLLFKQNKTKQNKTKQNKTKQNKTKQNKTKQNKTKQNKTKQNKTKQNKTLTKRIRSSPSDDRASRLLDADAWGCQFLRHKL